MKQKLKVHSMRTRPPGKESSNPSAKILLFRDVEALESAKLKLDVDPNVKSTDYMGMKAAENQVTLSFVFSNMYLFTDLPFFFFVRPIQSRIVRFL